MAIDKELIDELLGNDKRPKDRIGEKGLLKEFSLVAASSAWSQRCRTAHPAPGDDQDTFSPCFRIGLSARLPSGSRRYVNHYRVMARIQSVTGG